MAETGAKNMKTGAPSQSPHPDRGKGDDSLAEITIDSVVIKGYLPAALVRLNFFELLRSRSTQRLVAQHPALRDFFRYNYVNPDGAFPVAWWNVFERNSDTRAIMTRRG
ncbi:hypothetical protein Bbelb_407100 [Branchiostoma belcheri]|nr:hypothetical protein Bbelb_407100 [Branchiostoma belcheri]